MSISVSNHLYDTVNANVLKWEWLAVTRTATVASVVATATDTAASEDAAGSCCCNSWWRSF